MAEGTSPTGILKTAARAVAGMAAYLVLAVAAMSLLFAPPRSAAVVGALIAAVAVALAAVINRPAGSPS